MLGIYQERYTRLWRIIKLLIPRDIYIETASRQRFKVFKQRQTMLTYNCVDRNIRKPSDIALHTLICVTLLLYAIYVFFLSCKHANIYTSGFAWLFICHFEIISIIFHSLSFWSFTQILALIHRHVVDQIYSPLYILLVPIFRVSFMFAPFLVSCEIPLKRRTLLSA